MKRARAWVATTAALALAVGGCAPMAGTSSPSPPRTTASPTSEPSVGPSPTPSPVDGPFLGDIELADGRHLHLACSGSGSPTVILDAGYTSGVEAWGTVLARVSSFTHVCAYERAGVGDSSPLEGTKTASDIVDDLRELVADAEIPLPYVLVGHSIAGLHLRLMGGERREELAGMVFVDVSVPHQWATFLAALPGPTPGEPDWLPELRTNLASGWPAPEEGEHYDIAADEAAIEAVTSFGDLPIVVLTAGIQTITPAGDPLGDDLQAVWFDLHEELAALSSVSRHELVPGARHSIQEDRPNSVIDAIEELVEQARG